ncbi:exonuclease [Desulfomarina profundi]|uniref:Exonuclease n=1 Tax=Desulfomarina profundi TaxID=2772557 RepID=A0A8D5FHB7_9BACT|nr:ribonuclease H-like domain-containing protein [Desulfomarina profundi]BCL61348.1 exonuclease [Desulfomarina profundi]
MLKHTFLHIPGIGAKTEKRLWEAGITSWTEMSGPIPFRLPAAARFDLEGTLEQSRLALPVNPHFFTARLPAAEVWRIFPHYRHKTVYLDIETTGLGEGSEITTIALYDGQKILTYVNGKNLDDFVDDITNYQVIVSYNGRTFDIPFLEKFFKIKLDHAQIDLRYVLARLGLKGGLKGCEKQLGMNRGELDGVDGYFAVLLWQQYIKYNDTGALETLLAYNISDTVNLERLAVEAYNRNIAVTPFAEELTLPLPVLPRLEVQPDRACVKKIRRILTGR